MILKTKFVPYILQGLLQIKIFNQPFQINGRSLSEINTRYGHRHYFNDLFNSQPNLFDSNFIVNGVFIQDDTLVQWFAIIAERIGISIPDINITESTRDLVHFFENLSKIRPRTFNTVLTILFSENGNILVTKDHNGLYTLLPKYNLIFPASENLKQSIDIHPELDYQKTIVLSFLKRNKFWKQFTLDHFAKFNPESVTNFGELNEKIYHARVNNMKNSKTYSSYIIAGSQTFPFDNSCFENVQSRYWILSDYKPEDYGENLIEMSPQELRTLITSSPERCSRQLIDISHQLNFDSIIKFSKVLKSPDKFESVAPQVNEPSNVQH